MMECPYCFEKVPVGAVRCMHCHRSLGDEDEEGKTAFEKAAFTRRLNELISQKDTEYEEIVSERISWGKFFASHYKHLILNLIISVILYVSFSIMLRYVAVHQNPEDILLYLIIVLLIVFPTLYRLLIL